MNKRLASLAALIIGAFIIFAAYKYAAIKSQTAKNLELATLGSVNAMTGEVQHRLPQTTQILPLTFSEKATAPVLSGELFITQKASQLTFAFNGGALVELFPDSKLVAQSDATRAGAIIATLIEGEAQVVSSGSPGTFRLFKDGREVTALGSSGLSEVAQRIDPMAPVATPTADGATVTETLPAETPVAAAGASPRAATSRTTTVGTSGTLSNDDIRRALTRQSSFFQRCYFTYLNRSGQKSAGARTGTVTLGFSIESSGRVSGAKLVRSDFNDTILNSCVLETVERTQFRGFSGSAIPVLEFPIELK